MVKRPATEEVETSPSKRRYIEVDDLYVDDDGCLDKNGDDDDDDDDGFTPGATPSSSANAESPVTAATTPRTKFPSDFKTLACNWLGCTKSFNRPARLRDHMNSHTNSRPHKCPYDGCGKDYIEDKHLKQHIKAVHKNERKYVCQREGCGKSFVTGTRLKRHQAVHEGADRFRCQTCGQSFRKKETLNKHVRKDHMGQCAYPCSEPECDRGFDTKPALNRHKERDHGEPKFWCTKCVPIILEDGTVQGVGFTTAAFLDQHVKQEHQNCLFCDFKSTSRWEFQRHIDMYHSGKTVKDRKTVACPYPDCGKKFTKKANLKVHIRAAHEGFRFVCGQVDVAGGPGLEAWTNDQGCGDKFSTKGRLEDHIRFIHLGQERPKHSKPEKPTAAIDIIDELAGVTNIQKQSIKCSHCDEGFSRYFDLNAHIEKVHHDPTAAAADDFDLSDTFFLPEDFLPDQQKHLDVLDSTTPTAHWADALLLQQDGIFSAPMDYNPTAPPSTPCHDWFTDENNLLRLACEEAALACSVDPMLDTL